MSNHFFRPLRLTIRRAAVPLVAFAMIALPGSALAQGKDDMWEITSKMEMPGMPMAMPAQTIRQCVAKNAKDDDYIPKRDNCKVTDSKRVGNKVNYQMVCTGKDAMNVVGEVTSIRSLLARIPGLTLLALPEQPRCCGAAGSYFIEQPEMANRLRAEKLDQVQAQEPELLLTTNIGCRIHLGNGLRQRAAAIPVRHPLALLAQQLENASP